MNDFEELEELEKQRDELTYRLQMHYALFSKIDDLLYEERERIIKSFEKLKSLDDIANISKKDNK